MAETAKIIQLRETVPAAPTIARTYTVTSTHPPQSLAIGRERQGIVSNISCAAAINCTLRDSTGKALVSIDADGVDMACDIAFAGGALSVDLRTHSSVTFTVESQS